MGDAADGEATVGDGVRKIASAQYIQYMLESLTREFFLQDTAPSQRLDIERAMCIVQLSPVRSITWVYIYIYTNTIFYLIAPHSIYYGHSTVGVQLSGTPLTENVQWSNKDLVATLAAKNMQTILR